MPLSRLFSIVLLIIGTLLIVASHNGIIEDGVNKKLGITESINIKSVDPYVRVVGRNFYLYNKTFVPKGVCYYPRDYGWTKMWENFSKIESIIEEDMARAKALGVNFIKIFITYPSFNYSNTSDIKKLDRMLEIIDKYNMKAVVTLFEWSDPSQNLTRYKECIRSIVGTFKNDDRIFAWDIRSEPDHFYHYSWRPYVHKPQMLLYLRELIDEIKKIDSNHSVCVSEYGWYLGDRWTFPSTALYDNFNDNNYDGWIVRDGSWLVNGGILIGMSMNGEGHIYHSDTSWWNKWGVTIKVRMKTYECNNVVPAPVGVIFFRYRDPGNTYAVLIHLNGTIELAKRENGILYWFIAKAHTNLSALEWHTFEIVNFRNETEVYVDGKKYIYYWDPKPLPEGGGICFRTQYCIAAFDDVEVKLGPRLIDENIQKYCDFISFNWYEDPMILYTTIPMLYDYNKPVMIFQIGRPTGGVYDDGTPVPYNENDVARWMSTTLDVVKSYGYVYPCVWSLLDFSEEGASFFPPQSHIRFYGMYRLDYSLKPHGIIYRDNYTGTIIIDDSKFMSAEHPAVINCNSLGRVNITFRNVGLTSWDSSEGYSLVSREPDTWGVTKLNLSRVVYPEENYTFRFNVKAPPVPGKFSFSWQMMREKIGTFGERYSTTVKVINTSLVTMIDDEFNDLRNWSVFIGQGIAHQSHLVVESGGCVINKHKHAEIFISFRGYSSNVSNWQSGIIFAKIHVNLNNYLGFTIYGNGYVEIFYVYNGVRYANVSGTQTSINPNYYHTYSIIIRDKTMTVYIDGIKILSADISSYPYYNSLDYVGFYTQNSRIFIDHCALYSVPASEISAVLTLTFILILFIIILKRDNHHNTRK